MEVRTDDAAALPSHAVRQAVHVGFTACALLLRQLPQSARPREAEPAVSILEELRAHLVELGQELHAQRGSVARTWQQEFPETAALVKRLDDAIAALALVRSCKP